MPRKCWQRHLAMGTHFPRSLRMTKELDFTQACFIHSENKPLTLWVFFKPQYTNTFSNQPIFKAISNLKRNHHSHLNESAEKQLSGKSCRFYRKKSFIGWCSDVEQPASEPLWGALVFCCSASVASITWTSKAQLIGRHYH